MLHENLELATSSDGTTWDNPALLEKLLHSEPETGFWSLWNWKASNPTAPRVEITLLGPHDLEHSPAAQRLFDSSELQLRSAFGLFARERGWPLPSCSLSYRKSPRPEWTYRISLPGREVVTAEVFPEKILALGDEAQLSCLLGLETVDPFLGLPAKWIARSQIEAARSAQLHTFEISQLLAAHTLHWVSQDWSCSYGLLELQAWISKGVPSHANLLATLMPVASGLFFQTVKELIAEELWLPQPGRLLEHFLVSWSHFDNEQDLRFELILEAVRKEIVSENIIRFLDPNGCLNAIEWRGEASYDDDGAPRRLLARLEAALMSAASDPNTPIVAITESLGRRELRQALHRSFPQLTVLSWEEVPATTQVRVLATVNSNFEVDPSPWAYASFEVESN